MLNDMNKKNIKIMLVKSGIGRKSDQKKTLTGSATTGIRSATLQIISVNFTIGHFL